MKPELLNHFQSQQKSVEERVAAGKALRKKFPRIEQGEYKPSSKRTDPVAVLEEQAKTRIQDLVPIRYARMLTSPFAFLREGAAIMAADLAAGRKTSGINVQACGDMHVANFGVFASAERNLVFGINDFYVRQLRDMKGGVEFDPAKVKIENLPQYTSLCGWALAHAHARSGDAAIIAGYAGNSDELDEAMCRFSIAYADQTEKDYKALVAAAKKGRIKVAGE